jgi:uncharacterized protein YoxC
MTETRKDGRLGNTSPPPAGSRKGGGRFVTLILALLWLGALGAYLWGYFGPALFQPQPFGVTLGVIALALVPIMLVAALVELAIQGETLSQTNRLLGRLSLQVGDAQLPGESRATLMTGAVRRELDKLSGALDSTLDRVAAIEAMVENQVGAIERAGGKAHQRAQAIRDLLQQERDRLEAVAGELSASASAIAQSVSTEAGRVRQANEVAARELREAEGLLSRQLQSFKTLAEESGRAAHDRVAAIETAASKLETLVGVSLRGADILTERLDAQQAALAAGTRRLDEERTRLEASLIAQDTLITRFETETGGLSERLKGAVAASASVIGETMAMIEARAAEAARTLRAEAESASGAGAAAAEAITKAAMEARAAAAGMRSALSGEVTAFGEELGTGVRNLDAMAGTVGRALADTTQGAHALIGSLEETIETMESASHRLFGLFDQMDSRTSQAQNAIDNASVAMEQRLSQVPELAAEHAGRLSSLLEDQARRMGALADSLARRAQGSAPSIVPQSPEQESPAPAAPREEIASSAEPIDVPLFQRRARREANLAERGIGASGAAEAASIPRAFTREAELVRPAREAGLSVHIPWIGRKLRRNVVLKPAFAEDHHAPETASEPAAGGNGGFWSTLFARIEDDEPAGPMVPRGAMVGPPAGVIPPSIKTQTEYALEALYALAIDLDRLLEEDPPMELWKRYRTGEADAFARRLIGLKGAGLEHRIRGKYRDDPEFRDHANRYRERFGEVSGPAPGSPGSLWGTPAGRLFTLLDEALRPIAQ